MSFKSNIKPGSWGDTHDPDAAGRRIYVSGLARGTTVRDLEEFFGGRQVMQGISLYDFYAFIQFERPLGVVQAIQYNGWKLNGHPIKVRVDDSGSRHSRFTSNSVVPYNSTRALETRERPTSHRHNRRSRSPVRTRPLIRSVEPRSRSRSNSRERARRMSESPPPPSSSRMELNGQEAQQHQEAIARINATSIAPKVMSIGLQRTFRALLEDKNCDNLSIEQMTGMLAFIESEIVRATRINLDRNKLNQRSELTHRNDCNSSSTIGWPDVQSNGTPSTLREREEPAPLVNVPMVVKAETEVTQRHLTDSAETLAISDAAAQREIELSDVLKKFKTFRRK